MRVHTEERPQYPCTVCQKTFKTSTGLTMHIRADHTGKSEISAGLHEEATMIVSLFGSSIDLELQ